MRRLLGAAVVLGLIGVLVFYGLTVPRVLEAGALPDHEPDLANGERMFHAGGCASCHAAPASEKCDDPRTGDKLSLAGGRCLKTPFGTFIAPNISPDRQAGIGGWSDIDFVNAMARGVSPAGAHYYPAFPYTSYRNMAFTDLLDLKAFIDTLPAADTRAPDHDLRFPFSFRRGIGLWKLAYLDTAPFAAPENAGEKVRRGAYLVEGPGHCGECHTPRDMFGGLIASRKLSGGPSPEGGGTIPNITSHESGIGDWSEKDIVYALESGLTPSFDSFGGSMVAVQENMAKLPKDDREAIAAYLKWVPPVPGAGSAERLSGLRAIEVVERKTNADLVWHRQNATVEHVVGGTVAEDVGAEEILPVAVKWAALKWLKSRAALSPVAVSLSSGSKRYEPGAVVAVEVSGAKYPYLTMFNLPSDGRVEFLIPDPRNKREDVKDWRGGTITESFKVSDPPFGAEHLVAIFSEDVLTDLHAALRSMNTAAKAGPLRAVLERYLENKTYQVGILDIHTGAGKAGSTPQAHAPLGKRN